MRVYVDSAPVIYAVEQVAPMAIQVHSRFAVPGVQWLTSELTRFECRIMPLRNKASQLLSEYETFFSESISEMVQLSRPVLDRAAELRAKHRPLKTPDAIHLAAALLSNCDIFYTNDNRLETFREMKVEMVGG